MFFDILTYIKKERPNDQIIIGDGILELVKPGLGECRVYDNLKHELRDYQIQALLKALNSGRGVLKMGTGAGKTLTIASLLMSVFTINKNFKCLIIVPDLS
jgi:superfamily II DNA or RNA helicase